MICKNCNHNLPDDSEFCQYCGNKVEKEVVQPEEKKLICPKCNHVLPDDSEFCQYCGNKVEAIKAPEIVEKVQEKPIEDNPVSLEVDDEDVDDLDPKEALKTILEFQAKATVEAMEANTKEQPDNEADSDFGLVPHKPIYTYALQSVDGERAYLNNLYTENGEKIKWNRRGSMHVEDVNGMVDIYDTYLPSGKQYKTIYINMYGAKNSPKAPAGFVLKNVEALRINPPTKKAQKVKKHFCSRCGAEIDNKTKVCTGCGRKGAKGLKALLAVLGVVLVIGLGVLIMLISKYYQAEALFAQGEYTEAYEIYIELGGYADASEKAKECLYCKALVFRSEQKWHMANNLFEQIKDYKDSASLIHHQYEIIKAKEPTCTVSGYTEYKCSDCGHEYRESILYTGHNFSSATCTEPKKCTVCGFTSGSARGHSTIGVTCIHCGLILFETLEYSGTGDKIIRDIDLPETTFHIIGKATSIDGYSGSFYMYFYNSNGDQKAYWKESGTSVETIAPVRGAIYNGYMKIVADDNVKWTITIEALY